MLNVSSLRAASLRTASSCVRTLGVGEVDEVALQEDVDLLDPRDRVHAQPLERVLQPLVVRRRRLVHRLLLSASPRCYV